MRSERDARIETPSGGSLGTLTTGSGLLRGNIGILPGEECQRGACGTTAPSAGKLGSVDAVVAAHSLDNVVQLDAEQDSLVPAQVISGTALDQDPDPIPSTSSVLKRPWNRCPPAWWRRAHQLAYEDSSSCMPLERLARGVLSTRWR